jgi:dienelactone hydrolase
MTHGFGDAVLSLPTPEQHPAWLELRRQQLIRLLGGFPVHSPLRAQVVKRKEEADRIVELVQYESEPGEIIPAVVMIPKHRTPPLPALLCHHQHAGQYELGKSEVCGWAGNPQQAYAAELCARGYLTLAPDTICFEDRRDPRFDGEQYERFLSHELLLKGWTLQGKMIWDVKRAVEYLGTRPEVDKERIGMIGHSMGAAETWFSMPLEPKLKVGVASCATTTFASILAAGAIHNYGLYVPGLLQWGDTPDIVSMIAPRPFFLLTGEQDWRFPVSGAKEVYTRAKMMYQRLGAGEAIDLYISPGPHEFNDEMRKRAYNWIDRWL